ncbi:MAG: hypothetical protein AAGD35_14280 [Actinomycetota bacterium]
MTVSDEVLAAMAAHRRHLHRAADEVTTAADRRTEAAAEATRAWRGPTRRWLLRQLAEEDRGLRACARDLRIEADAWDQARTAAVQMAVHPPSTNNT